MDTVDNFIAKWRASGGQEMSNAQTFVRELCDELSMPRPGVAMPANEENTYCFERKIRVTVGDMRGELRRLDCYHKGSFVMECKQGQDKPAPDQRILAQSRHTAAQGHSTEQGRSSAPLRGSSQWETMMQRAKLQAEYYVRSLPAQEGRPPFVIVADVGYCFDIYAEFSCSGGLYQPFPAMREHRIFLEDLRNPDIRQRLQTIWRDPLSLDPARRSAQVTEKVASHLAKLAHSLERDGHGPERVSGFLMRCIFTMFAEDVCLIPHNCFTNLLCDTVDNLALFVPCVSEIWHAMNSGGVSTTLGKELLRINGNIFINPEVLPLNKTQIRILLAAAYTDWREVEPAIFGTLLENALNPKERHALGAHYTPRSYVERLVLPTVIMPLRVEWDEVRDKVQKLTGQDRPNRQDGQNGRGAVGKAVALVADFHKRLCEVQILDPACGSGNFLYVALEHLKRLEGEVLHLNQVLGGRLPLTTVEPRQFLGLEVNPRAAHIAEMVLWIGYLQWHYRTHGLVHPPEPVLKKSGNILHQDALISWRHRRVALDAHGKPRTHWNGETTRIDHISGRDVPDTKAVVAEYVYEGVTPARWPKAEFIVGNPPFIGGKHKRDIFGHGYFDALAQAYPDLPESCDYVMYWWHKAALLVRAGKARQFGFITTNSITQSFNRRVLALHMQGKRPLHLPYAIADHPWADVKDGANVRIAMTVGARNAKPPPGVLGTVISERRTVKRDRDVDITETHGYIYPNLRQDVNITGIVALQANKGLSSQGMKPHGKGFVITPKQAYELGLGRVPGLEAHIRPYRNGRDIANKPRGTMFIDLYGLTEEQVQKRYSDVYQWLYDIVRPMRAQNNRESYREDWWIFGEPRKLLRSALIGLSRYIVTPMTGKHRPFVFMDANILPDQSVIAIASDDAYYLGVLSSRIHVCWAIATGGTLGPGHRYNNSICFAAFPFPDATPEQTVRIRALGERLDTFRKDRQALYPDLTLTNIYNALAGLRIEREFTEAERTVYTQSLSVILRQYHDELDTAVAEAYGFAADMPDTDILAHLTALNTARAEEEKKGLVRWLRPEYQEYQRTAAHCLSD